MRKIVDFCGGWRFQRKENEAWESVNLPHTWNAEDGQDGGNDYYRGVCLYEKEFGKPEGERVFLEVGAAGHTCEVVLNGESLGTHEGGYSAFRFEMTEKLRENNILQLKVDNRENDRVYPQKADFTFYGGVYRAVKLIIVPEEHFELVKDGTPGIKVTPELNLETGMASVKVETWQNAENVIMEVNGESRRVVSENGHAETVFGIPKARKWDGTRDPYMYTAKARLDSGDEVSARFGCRVFGFDPEKGFLLNGRRYPLRGVSRHQDRKGKGNAITKADHEEDMRLIREIGANTVRLAHYQHAQEFYDLCDENGIVVWAEIPYITMHMQNAREDTISQMREMITQCHHHPSIAVWGLSNEITAASAVNEDLMENHRALNELCHRMDPTRKTVMANVFMLETDSELLKIPDINSYNLYFGWYLGELKQNDEFFDGYHRKYPEWVIGLSEYGADANPALHSGKPERGDYTEEYQCVYHEHMLNMIEERPWLWATHVWNMFDFAADGRDEGGKHGENQKGLVTFDRQTRKDAFYLYKAAWNREEAFVHLCAKRYAHRAGDETEIKVYSNQSRVTLYVDGKQTGEAEGKTVFRFTIPLTGEHTIRVVADGAADEMVIRKVAEEDESYHLTKVSAEVENWFDGEMLEDHYSVRDTLGELRKNPQAAAVVNAMMEKASASRGDVADAVKDNPGLQKMLERMTLVSLLKQGGADEESVKQLNRILQGIAKC